MNQISRYSLLLSIFFLAIVLPCSAQRSASTARPKPSTPNIKYDEQTWQEYSFPEGSFAVSLPGKPVENINSLDTKIGQLNIFDYLLKAPRIEYIVRYFDLPEKTAAFLKDPERIQGMLNNGIDNVLKTYKGKLSEQSNISVNNYPGREFKVEVPNQVIISGKILQAGLRSYQVLVVTPIQEKDAKLYDSSVKRFLNSFRLIGGND